MTTQKFIDLSTLSKKEARILIARDVLKQLDLKKILATEGVYVVFESENKPDPNSLLHEVLAQQTCETCALGALYYSRVQIANGLTCEDTFYDFDNEIRRLSDSKRIEELSRYFDDDQIKLIEAFFEGWCFDAAKFYENNEDPEIRMRKIMINIIENDGTFNPSTLVPKAE